MPHNSGLTCHSVSMSRFSIVYDRFLSAMLATVGLAMLLPASGAVAESLHAVSTLAIALLFFLHGARLPREAIVAGLTHWRLHLLVLAVTFVFFPLLGIAIKHALPPAWIGSELMLGVLFLSALPSTVQSSIAFTSMAHGNVAAAVCSASLSNLAGVLLTPLLAACLLGGNGETSLSVNALTRIVLQLALPFVAGHLARPWLARWLERRRSLLAWTDRGTVLLVVYLAISASVIEGLWRQLPFTSLTALFLIVGAILATALLFTHCLSLRLGFKREDRIAIVFCGSKKSLASGVPIANVLFAGNPALGMIVLPVLIYHQIQLIACAVIAQRYARQH